MRPTQYVPARRPLQVVTYINILQTLKVQLIPFLPLAITNGITKFKICLDYL